MKYLVIGTGGVGGSIASFLALANKDVTCIARGQHLDLIRKEGLQFDSDLKGSHRIALQACTAEEYHDKADVIIVCVKGYSLESVADVVDRASNSTTIVIPILNVYGSGPKLERLAKFATVIDGCIYIVGFLTAPGHVRQLGSVFTLIFGARNHQHVQAEALQKIAADMQETGMVVKVSADINRDTFVKWGFISAMACTGTFYDCPMGRIQQEGEARDTFRGMSEESLAIGRALHIEMPDNYVEHNLDVIDHLDPASTASMQKDIKKGHQSEIQGQFFDMIDLGHRLGVTMPTYEMMQKRMSGFMK